jgi:hypothetical protein
MPCGALPSTLKWTEAASNTYCNYEAPFVWSSDSLRHLTVTCILKTKCQRTYVILYYMLFFIICFWQEITLWRAYARISFHPVYHLRSQNVRMIRSREWQQRTELDFPMMSVQVSYFYNNWVSSFGLADIIVRCHLINKTKSSSCWEPNKHLRFRHTIRWRPDTFIQLWFKWGEGCSSHLCVRLQAICLIPSYMFNTKLYV